MAPPRLINKSLRRRGGVLELAGASYRIRGHGALYLGCPLVGGAVLRVVPLVGLALSTIYGMAPYSLFLSRGTSSPRISL